MNEQTSNQAEIPEQNRQNFWKEFAKLALIALIVIVPFRLFIAQPFIVDGASMDPTFADGEYLIVDELSYRFREPARGEVLIFKYPQDPCAPWKQQLIKRERSQCRYFIKRIIGLPSETVSIVNGKVTILNNENPEGFVLDEPYVKLAKADTERFTLGNDEYFVMGDNRAQSADSRLWGPVPRENFIGRPFARFIPPALFPGASAYREPNKAR